MVVTRNRFFRFYLFTRFDGISNQQYPAKSPKYSSESVQSHGMQDISTSENSSLQGKLSEMRYKHRKQSIKIADQQDPTTDSKMNYVNQNKLKEQFVIHI